MRQLPQDKMLEDVAAAQRRMVEGFLANGDPANPKFRRICYAASAEALKRYVRDRQDKLTPSEIATLKDLVVSSMTKVEETHGDDGQLRQFINTVLDEPERANRVRPPSGESSDASIAGRDDAASPPGKKSWRAPAIGFFIGSTLVLLGLQLLQTLNVVYIHHQPEGFQQLKQLNQAMAEVKPSIAGSIDVLNQTRDRLTVALSNGEFTKENNPKIFTHFKNLSEVFPDLFSDVKQKIPRSSQVIIRLGDKNGYKILFVSQICQAVSLTNPELVDVLRNYSKFFCRYFGLWNREGRTL